MALSRVCELYIGTFANGNRAEKSVEEGSGFLVQDLHFDFSILRTVDFYKNLATFRLYNANAETIAFANEGKAVVFRAGYKDENVGTIFIGQIDECYTDRMSNGDIITTIVCVSQRGAQYPLGRVITTLSFPAGSTYYDVLKFIADFAGVPLSGASTLKDFTLDSRYYDVGSVSELVSNFKNSFLIAEGGNVIIDNNEMLYIQKENVNYVEGDNESSEGHTIIETIALTLRSGLLNAKRVRKSRSSVEDKFRKNLDYYMGLRDTPKKEEKDKEEPAKPLAQIEFTCILIPDLSPNTPVYVDNRRFVGNSIDENDKLGFFGTYQLTEINFRGNNYGGQYEAVCKGEQRG